MAVVNLHLDQPLPAAHSSIPTNAAAAASSRPDYNDGLELDDEPAAVSPSSSCLCFPVHCFRRRRTTHAGSRKYFLQEDSSEDEDGGGRWSSSAGGMWVVEKLKKAREMSEVVAGPRWKNFIRRFSGSLRAAVGSVSKKKRASRKKQCQYDLHSYALNFDDGDNTADDDCRYPDFSARFPPSPPTAATQS